MNGRGQSVRFCLHLLVMALAQLPCAYALAQDAQKGKAAPADAPPQGAPMMHGVRLLLDGGQGNLPSVDDVMEEQRQRYRALTISELHFCRAACGLTKEQSERIGLETGAMVEHAAARGAELELAIARRGGMRTAKDPVPSDPVKVVREGLLKIVKEHASTAQVNRYQVELTKRAAFVRQSAVRDLVARLDQMLILTGDQRERLAQVLDSNWEDDWGSSAATVDGFEGPIPAIHDRLVVPLLGAAQQKLWKRINKQSIDATDAFINSVTDVLDGLPSDFAERLDAGAKAAAAKPAAAASKKGNSK